jgi:hypothetical protein
LEEKKISEYEQKILHLSHTWQQPAWFLQVMTLESLGKRRKKPYAQGTIFRKATRQSGILPEGGWGDKSTSPPSKGGYPPLNLEFLGNIFFWF